MLAFAAPLPFEWNGRRFAPTVDRRKPPLVLIGGGRHRENLIVILATNVDEVATAMAQPVRRGGAAGQFSVPPAILANLPESERTTGPVTISCLLSSIEAQRCDSCVRT